MTDRRRINGPPGGTAPPVFTSTLLNSDALQAKRPRRTRRPDEVRNIFLKTGITPSAPGSAYLELSPSPPPTSTSTTTPPLLLPPTSSSLKLACTVHGPKPLPRSAPFSPHLVLSTHVKFAPFATRRRRGYVRDTAERDLGVHLETALRGVVIGERWPKSGVEVVVTVLEGEEDAWWGDEGAVGVGTGVGAGWGLMNVLAGCVTVASAAIVDAGVDCVDLVAGGVAAVVRNGETVGKKGLGLDGEEKPGDGVVVLDPSPPEHREIVAACVVGYLSSRDEITELWMKGDAGERAGVLVDRAVETAMLTRTVLVEAVTEAADVKFPESAGNINGRTKNTGANDTVMVG